MTADGDPLAPWNEILAEVFGTPPPEPPSRLAAFQQAHPVDVFTVTLTAGDGSQWTGHGSFTRSSGTRRRGPVVTAQLRVVEDTADPPF